MSIRNYDPLNEQDPELTQPAKPALRWTAGQANWLAHYDANLGWRVLDLESDNLDLIADVDPNNIAEELGKSAEDYARLLASAPDLASALLELRKQLREHVKLDVKKHYSLMLADVAADKALRKAGAL